MNTKYLRVDCVELGENHTIDLVEATRRGIIRQRLDYTRKRSHSVKGLCELNELGTGVLGSHDQTFVYRHMDRLLPVQ